MTACYRCGEDVEPRVEDAPGWLLVAVYRCPHCSFGWDHYLALDGSVVAG